MNVGRNVGVFHPGTQHSWQTALAFQERERLAWYATSIFYNPRRWPYRIERFVPRHFSQQLLSEFRRRYTPSLDLDYVRQFGKWEWFETVARRLNWLKLAAYCDKRGNITFGDSVTELIKREPVDVLWGYNAASVRAFKWATQHGIRCILDQTIGHPRHMNEVMLREWEENPEFFLNGIRLLSQKWLDQQDEELALADEVVVGSNWCAQSVREHGCPGDKIRVIHYGYDDTLYPGTPPEREDLAGRLVRFLFVGTGGWRKGLAYLLKAFVRLPEAGAKLTVVGRLEVPNSTIAQYQHRFTHIPQVPRSELPKYMRDADCFVFPSLFEGSSLVLHEAVGAGLGIIQSKAAGVGVIDGRNGVCIDTVSVQTLTDALQSVLDNRQRLAEWQNASWSMRSHWTWDRYRENIFTLANV